MHEGKDTSVEDSNCLGKCAYGCSNAEFIFLANGKIKCPKCKENKKGKEEFWPKDGVKKITGVPCAKDKSFYIECPTYFLRSCSFYDDLNEPHLPLEVQEETFLSDGPAI